jgi:DNA-binding transcriptional regulator YiaG
MSTKSELMARFGQRVRILDVDRVSSGSPVRLVLRRGGLPNTPEAAVCLLRRHLPMRAAYTALTEMMDTGLAYVSVPMVENVAVLIDELALLGVLAKQHAPGPLDVRAVRDATKLSQEAFALRFGLDPATVQDWEQGHSEPDTAALTLLWTILRHPDAVESALEMDEPMPAASMNARGAR